MPERIKPYDECLWCDAPCVDGTSYCAEHIGEARRVAIRQMEETDPQDAPELFADENQLPLLDGQADGQAA